MRITRATAKIMLMITGVFVLNLLFPGKNAEAQYREYAVHGFVIDTEKKPLPGVEVILVDHSTARKYRVLTDKKGKFSIVGIPHAVYQVTFRKEGYETRTLEWNLSAPQERIQKVEYEPVILASEDVVIKAAKSKEAKARLTEVLNKITDNDIDGAVTILKRMIEEEPKDSNAFYLLAICYSRQKNFASAVELLKEVIELSPEFAGAYHQLGIAYQGLGDNKSALDYYQKSLEKDPKLIDSLYNAGLILFGESHIESALEYFNRAINLKPAEPEFLEMAGRCYINLGDLSRAIEYLEKARNAYRDPDKISFLDSLIAKLKEKIK